MGDIAILPANMVLMLNSTLLNPRIVSCVERFIFNEFDGSICERETTRQNTSKRVKTPSEQ